LVVALELLGMDGHFRKWLGMEGHTEGAGALYGEWKGKLTRKRSLAYNV